jgi:dTDP-4-amino-4,6-dideoxygalactose transaminase
MKIFQKPIFVSVSPNAQPDDVWLALKLIFQPWRWKKGECAERLERMLGDYLNNSVRGQTPDEVRAQTPSHSVVLFESGRTALYAILMALGIKQGDEVLMQAFTCTAAVNPILWVGAKPVYVDIIDGEYNMSPEDLEKKITQRSKAIIVQHTFGFPARMDEILEIARRNNLLVIEDCAHSLGAAHNGKKLGIFGDAAIFSFGRSKVISSVFGGAAYAKNSELAKKINEIRQTWSYPSSVWILQQLFHPVYLAIAKPFYNFLSIGKAMVVVGKKIGLLSKMVYIAEKSGGHPPFGPGKIPNALACLAAKQLGKLEKFNEHRQEIAEFYYNELKDLSEIHLPPAPSLLRRGGIESVFLLYPVLTDNFKIRQNCIYAARKQGVYLEVWPAYDRKVIGPDNVNLEKLYYIEGFCLNAEKAAQTSINLPTGPNITMGDAKRVVKFLKSFLRNN